MEGQLKSGTILTSEGGNKYTLITMLGAGGQGEVYDVDCGGKHYALKWYYKHMATREQKSILDNLVEKGSPDTSFLWPQDIIFTELGESFGYIMPLRSKNYKSIVDMMKRRAEPSFYALCRAAYNLTKGYKQLHSLGYSYRDISFGNVFFNPDTGDVLICDNDNVCANGATESAVYGTPRFMAPEIVIGKSKPSRNTDLFSLAVLLFYMFMLGHPLEGKKEAAIKCMDIHAMNMLYGKEPVFIFDPNDKSNRPVAGYQDNPIIYWDLYPKYLKQLFEHSFTVGLSAPNKRVTENQWLDAILNMMSGIVHCPKCDSEVFYDTDKVMKCVGHTCWSCKSNVTMPPVLAINKFNIALVNDAKVYSHHIVGDYDVDTVVGNVVRNPKNPKQWGLCNCSNINWTYIKPDGQQIAVENGKRATIAKGVKINFGQVVGEFL
ncbi:protein kinase [Ruminococcus sp.]|uniref:protein kinase domain-containing protein n=1 Tax=Ruminococcus sp. TaxID=41978 RepID=UPI002589D0E2|nr:protein kinase [Ruminococcus sp.]MCR5019714.1 protein kinase [Ruminococcus sp.]